MTIFEFLNSLLFSKKKIDLNCDDESQFSLFMVNRWTSMHSKELATYINDTSNKYWDLFSSKKEQYEYMYYLIPRLKFKRLNYLKKTKKEKKKKEDIVYVPEWHSEREYKLKLELLKQYETTV